MTTDLERMQADQEVLMTETVYIQKRTKVSDGAGGFAETWNTVVTVKGRIAPISLSGREVVIGGRITPTAAYVITLPWDTEVEGSDRLQIVSTQYEVVKIEERSGKTALRVLCNKVG